MTDYFFTFESTHRAMEAVDKLGDIPHKIFPTPMAITRRCGISVGVDDEYFEAAKTRLLNIYSHIYKGDNNDCTH